MLEARWIWGDEALHDITMQRFRAEIVAGTARDFVASKLAERDARAAEGLRPLSNGATPPPADGD